MNYLVLLGAATEGTGQNPLLPTILIYGALFAFMWFVLIRPQRKRQKEMQALQSSIEVGDSILLASGMYGKIVDTVNDVVIVELGMNKGVRVPVQRSGIVSKAEPDLTITKDSEE